jgi:SAM-dependent methyltransferase
MPQPEPPVGRTASATDESFDGWEASAGGWERRRAFVWEASRKVSERLVDLLDPQPGQSLLELAAGTGDTGFLAAERIRPAGRLISSDFVPGMVAAAERRSLELDVSNVDFRVLDAQALDLADESVDGVLCRWGYMLVPEPAKAFAETTRVLRAGGHVAFAVWASADENPLVSAIGRVLVARGLVARPEPDAPGPFRLADPEHVRALVENAGLELVRQEDVALTWRFGGFDEYWDVTRDLSRSLAASLEEIDDEKSEAIKADVRQALEPYYEQGGLALPALTRITLARRPR